MVLECIPDDLRVKLRAACLSPPSGSAHPIVTEVLVSYDLLGLTAKTPSFVKKYAQLDAVVTDAARAFVRDVKATAALKARSDG